MEDFDELKKILDTGNIATVFQPIVSLKDSEILGYEALSRGPKESPLFYPEKLFNVAENCNRLWDLEFLCRTKAIEKAAKIDKNKFLFLNVDPLMIKDEKFEKGFTKNFLAKHNISPESIIFEITERTAIEDYKSFTKVLNNYVEQGYKIAIDDTGAGYSGLKTIAETKPQYIKLDMSLIKDIDKDAFKQAIVKTFVTLSLATNMKIIAEGIETEKELEYLIKLGVYAGQGFFLQRPADTFLDIPESVKKLILKYNKILSNSSYFDKIYIGQIVTKEPAFNFNVPCSQLKIHFINSCATGACVLNGQLPIGLVMKHTLNSMLATQYGNAVFSRRPISLIMDSSPLIVDYYTSVGEVSNRAMDRENEKIYDYVIVTKDSKYYGIVTIKKLLEYTTMLERNYARELNPLTGLPGNMIIEKVLLDLLSYKRDFCVLYFDLDNFKAYNDTYGFENGDKILIFTANLIQDFIKTTFPYNSFIGHIGGDDFVSVIEAPFESCSELCKKIISSFDEKILNFFNEKDKANGYIIATDRKGHKDTFGLTSISIAGLHGNFDKFSSSEKVSKYISDIKKQVKKVKFSNYFVEKIKEKW